VGGEAADNTLWGFGAAYAAGRQCMIAHDNLVAAVGNVYPGRVVLNIDPRKALKSKV